MDEKDDDKTGGARAYQYAIQESLISPDTTEKEFIDSLSKASSDKDTAQRLNVPMVPTDTVLEDIRAWHWKTRGAQLCNSDYADIYEIITKIAAGEKPVHSTVRINDDDIDPVKWEETHIDVVTAACLLMEEPKSVIVRWLLTYSKPTAWVWRGQEWIDKGLFFQTLKQVRQLDQKAKGD